VGNHPQRFDIHAPFGIGFEEKASALWVPFLNVKDTTHKARLTLA
jgi:hypothetical protein